MVKIKSVINGSPAYECGIAEGDILVSINGNTIKDVLDYMYYGKIHSILIYLHP